MQKSNFKQFVFSLLSLPFLTFSSTVALAQVNMASYAGEGHISPRPLDQVSVTGNLVHDQFISNPETILLQLNTHNYPTYSTGNPYILSYGHRTPVQWPASSSPQQVISNNWQGKRLTVMSPEYKGDPNITFNTDGTIYGNGSCNSFFGSYSLSGNQITIGSIGATMMACFTEDLDRSERRFHESLSQARFFRKVHGGIVLSDASGQDVVVLTKKRRSKVTQMQNEKKQSDRLTYGGFTIDLSIPGNEEFEWAGKIYTHKFIRDSVRALIIERPYSGPSSRDMRMTPFGRGSGTGLRLIKNYLAEIGDNTGGNFQPVDDTTKTDNVLAYAGFRIKTERPATDVVTISGKKYSLGFIRVSVKSLINDRPYNGPVTMDLYMTDFGSGSGTGFNLISGYLKEIAPSGNTDPL